MLNYLSDIKFDAKFSKEIKAVLKKLKVKYIETELENDRIWLAFFEADEQIINKIHQIVGE